MRIQRRIIVELPFNLNVPTGTYHVRQADKAIALNVLQDQLAGHLSLDPDGDYLLATRNELAASARRVVHYERVRTVVAWNVSVDVADAEVHFPSENEVFDEVRREIIRRNPGNCEHLEEQAKAQITEWNEEQAVAFRARLGRKLTAQQRFPNGAEEFLEALNQLIRCYMATFGDFFVEEVTAQQLGGTLTKGIPTQWIVDGECVETVAYVGKIPAIMRGQWFEHGEDAVRHFREALEAGASPDSITLLIVRARALVERGAYRSAIIEASAALETAVARRLHRGLLEAGLNEAQANLIMKSAEGFDTRAKKYLKEFVGASAAEVDPELWQRVVAHRSTYRHQIAHSDLEPTLNDAETAVQDFAALAEQITSLVSA